MKPIAFLSDPFFHSPRQALSLILRQWCFKNDAITFSYVCMYVYVLRCSQHPLNVGGKSLPKGKPCMYYETPTKQFATFFFNRKLTAGFELVNHASLNDWPRLKAVNNTTLTGHSNNSRASMVRCFVVRKCRSADFEALLFWNIFGQVACVFYTSRIFKAWCT